MMPGYKFVGVILLFWWDSLQSSLGYIIWLQLIKRLIVIPKV